MEEVKRVIAIVLCFVFLVAWTGLGFQALVQIYNRSDREELKRSKLIQIERLKKEVEHLEAEAIVLRSCCHWEVILSEILSSQEKAELNVIEESLRQKIQKEFRRKEGIIGKG